MLNLVKGEVAPCSITDSLLQRVLKADTLPKEEEEVVGESKTPKTLSFLKEDGEDRTLTQ